MNLKDFLATRDKPPELYWSLVIEPGWVQAGIWYISGTTAEVVSVSPGAAWEVEDELVGATDAALSSAVQKLPENYPEPNKTVFGVPSAWVKGGEITEEYLAKIKKLCTDLSLSPVGFVVLPEAIAHLYKSEEGSPLSAVVVGLGNEFLEISVFKLGNLAGSTNVARSVSLIEDVTEGLTRFEGASPLPSRFVVFDGKGGELEEAKEALMQASWEGNEKIKFLHTPKAETLVSDRKVLATALAGAAEIGNVSRVSASENLPVEEEIAPGPEIENVAPAAENVSPEDLGFAVNQDVTATTPKVSEEPHHVEKEMPIVPRPVTIPKPDIAGYISKTKSLFHGFSSKFFPKTMPAPKVNKRMFTLWGVVFGVLLVVLGLFWWFIPKARVLVYVTPKNFQQVSEITFNSEGSSDVTGGILPAKSLTTQVSGDKTKSATGSKLIGEKAKGTIQIANGNSSAISLAAGTMIVSSGGLKFTSDNEASVSAQLLPGSPGTADVNVTAADIGAQYNLAKGEVFRIGNYSKALVAGTSTADFSGGSSQQISAVSADDQKTLENQLMDELKSKALEELAPKASDDQIFITDLATTEISSENFDHKVGDQADSLKLSLTLDVTALAADREKLLEYAKGVLKDKIPGGFVLRESQISFDFKKVSNKDGNYKYEVTISANFLPQVDIDAIIKQILGKTPQVTETYLTSIPGFARAEVTINPHFPGPLGIIPRVSKNITVEVVAEK